MTLQARRIALYWPRMERLDHFNKLQNHPWLHKVWAKLKPTDVELCRKFLLDNAHLNKNEFALVAERMFCHCGANRPKAEHAIVELLICANSALPAAK